MRSVSTRCPRLVLSLVALLFVPIIAAAQDPASSQKQDAIFSQKLYGVWYTHPAGNPYTDALRHEFRHNSTTGKDEMVVSHTCAAGARIVVAKAVSPIDVTEDAIRVLKSASDAVPLQGTADCEANIVLGQFSYSFSEDGEHLILTQPGGNPDYLDLVHETKADDSSVPQRLYGTWLLPPIDGKEMRVQVRWVFYSTAEHEGRVRQIAVCSKGNESLVSHVDSDISVSKDQIRVLQSASNQQQEGSFVCKASILPATWRYALSPSGVTLTLYVEGAPKPLILTREHEPGLN